MELTNIDPATIDQIYKKASISLCSNVAGQVTVGLMVNPPKKGDASYSLYHKETTGIYGKTVVCQYYETGEVKHDNLAI